MQTGYDFLCVWVYPEADGDRSRRTWRCRSCVARSRRPYGISKGAIQEEFSDEDSYSEYYY